MCLTIVLLAKLLLASDMSASPLNLCNMRLKAATGAIGLYRQELNEPESFNKTRHRAVLQWED
jgi:hypothetical protein